MLSSLMPKKSADFKIGAAEGMQVDAVDSEVNFIEI